MPAMTAAAPILDPPAPLTAPPARGEPAPPPAEPMAPQPHAVVGEALRRPEAWTAQWTAAPRGRRADLMALGALLSVAALGVGAYGAAVHAPEGAAAAATGALAATAGAGIAWMASLPTLLIVGALLGSPLRGRAVIFAAAVTVSFAGLAMLASVPVLWFFTYAAPGLRAWVVLASFAGVGLCMADVFRRVMRRLDAARLLHLAWLALLGLIGAEMFAVLGLFKGL